MKRWIFEGKVVKLLRESLEMSEKGEYNFLTHVINYVSNFIDANKLKEVVSNICLIFKIPIIKENQLYKYASKIVMDEKNEETEIVDKRNSFSILSVSDLQESKENQINEIIKNLTKEKKLIFLKYQVIKAIELFDILSRNMKLNIKEKEEKKKINDIEIETKNKITNIIINGKEYSGISIIIYILHNLLVNMKCEECLVEKINLKYCSESDVLKLSLRNINSI
ncbi:hypothetical protein, partial [Plasmodium yoelii yoelii]